MKKIILAILFILLTVSCEHSIKKRSSVKNTLHSDYVLQLEFDTIKISDSTHVVNAIYINRNNGSMSAVKICNIYEE